MKKVILTLTLAIALILPPLSSASAQCYGDAAESYGCAVEVGAGSNSASSRSATIRAPRGPASLEAFGSQAPVLPDTRFMRQSERRIEYVSPEERYEMMRNIVLGRNTTSYNQGLHASAINGGSQTWRPSSGGAMGRGGW
jgi:hypothetical protein